MPEYNVEFRIPGETGLSLHTVISRKDLTNDEIKSNIRSYYSRQIEAESRGLYEGKDPKDFPYIPTNAQVPLEKGGVLIVPPKFATDSQAHMRGAFESYISQPVKEASKLIQAPGEALAPTLGPLVKAPGKAIGGLAEMMTDSPQDLLGNLGSALGPMGYTAGRGIGNILGGGVTSAQEFGKEAGQDAALGLAAQLGTNWLSKQFLALKDAHVTKQLEKHADDFMSQLQLPNASKEEMLRNPKVFFNHLQKFQNDSLKTLINDDMAKAAGALAPLVNPKVQGSLKADLVKAKEGMLHLGELDKIADPRSYFGQLKEIEDSLANAYKTALLHNEKALAGAMFNPNARPGLVEGSKQAVEVISQLRSTISQALQSNAELETRKYIVQKIAEGANPQKAMMEAMAALKARNGDIEALSNALFTRTVELTKNPQLSRAISTGQLSEIADSVVTDAIKGTGKQGLTLSLLKAGAGGIQAGAKVVSPLFKSPSPRSSAVLNPTAIELIKESLGLKSKPPKEN